MFDDPPPDIPTPTRDDLRREEAARERMGILRGEFKRQMAYLVDCGLLDAAGLSEDAYKRRLLWPLDFALSRLYDGTNAPTWAEGNIPLLVVLTGHVVPLLKQITMRKPDRRAGSFDGRLALDRIRTADDTSIRAVAYLAIDVDPGAHRQLPIKKPEEQGDIFEQPTPRNEAEALLKANRFPCTLEEGIALDTHYGASLRERWKNDMVCLPGTSHLRWFGSRENTYFETVVLEVEGYGSNPKASAFYTEFGLGTFSVNFGDIAFGVASCGQRAFPDPYDHAA
ncbi:MAG: hypothetical protein QY323_04985 [Patescibacteria group bacterium]|nr:MAG: hypothetical protein QY323_04985 [Patescibacteria group bacterium]